MKSLFVVLIVAVAVGFLVFNLHGGAVQNSRINLENYSKIQKDMTFEWVQDILGPPSRTVQEVIIGDKQFGTYQWEDKKNNVLYIIVTENGKVKERMNPIPTKEYQMGERGVGVRNIKR
ncbi:MAG: hypothetical protein PHV17_05010 [Candidatus Omnitrophica bacterium]|nr:hypothetical protein [Candidatus Omnitrophota bacterium]